MKRKKSIEGGRGVATGPAQESPKVKQEESANTDGDFATGLSRRQVAEILRVSISAVRRMEGKALHPRLVNGMWLFKRDEVASLHEGGKIHRLGPSRSEGDMAGEIFKRLRRGQGLCQIVEEMHLPPERVRALFREWSTPLGEEPANSSRRLLDEDADLERWEEHMHQQIAEAEDLDRRDREEREVRRESRLVRVRSPGGGG